MTTEALTRHVPAAHLNGISLKTMQNVIREKSEKNHKHIYLLDAAVKAKKWHINVFDTQDATWCNISYNFPDSVVHFLILEISSSSEGEMSHFNPYTE